MPRPTDALAERIAALRALSLAALVAALALAGCAPTVIERGPASTDPRLEPGRFIADDGARLRLHEWKPGGAPRAVIVAVHGMNEHGRVFALPAERWRAAGIATYAFDQRGFAASPNRGLWPGSDNLVRDLALFIRLVAARHTGSPVFLLGESMGGAVALLTVVEAKPDNVAGLILLAPAASPWKELPFPWRASLWLAAHAVPWLPLTGEGLDLRPTDNIELWREYSKDPEILRETRADAIWGLTRLMDQAAAAAPWVSVPTLLLYGAHDDFVRDWMIDSLRARLPRDRVTFVRFPDGYHWLLRDLDPEAVHATIFDWIAGNGAGQMAGDGPRDRSAGVSSGTGPRWPTERRD